MPVLSTDSTGLVSPEINANHTVTLRLRSAIATSTIAMWSSAIFDDPSVLLARLIAAPENLKHSFLYVHVGVGQQDTLYASSSAMDNFLTSQKIDHEFTPTPGTHSWLLWRSYLVDFLPKFSAVAQ
jgi:enterochelin esterase-like enzyme